MAPAIIAVESDSDSEDEVFRQPEEGEDGEGSDTFDFFDMSSSRGAGGKTSGDALSSSLGNSGTTPHQKRMGIGVARKALGSMSIGSSGSSKGPLPSAELNESLGKASRNESGSSLQRQLSQEISRSSSRQSSTAGRRVNSQDPLNASLGPAPVVTPKLGIDTHYFVEYNSEIARGTKTVVRKCIERKSGKRYAVKSVALADKVECQHMRTEAALLMGLDHPSIIKIHDVYIDNTHLHMILELCKGGEMFDHVINTAKAAKSRSTKKEGEGEFSHEAFAAVVCFKVVDAVAYLHDKDIVHRDLKLENILFLSKQSTSGKKKKAPPACLNVRLIDFGLSRRYNTHHRFASLKKMSSYVGTKYYVAPEVLNNSYTHAADIWSIGVLAFALLCAKCPFQGRDDQELFDHILHCDETGVSFPSEDWEGIGEDAKSFIRAILVKDEDKRPSAQKLLAHPWMVSARKWQAEMNEAAAEAARQKKSLFKKVLRLGQ